MVVQQRNRPRKTKGVADVVFVLDNSGSMSSAFAGVRDHIGDFVHGVGADPQRPVDLRMALLAAGAGRFVEVPFTTATDAFRRAIATVDCTGNNEYTLPALDYALDMDWRPAASHFVVLLTDEPIEGGAEVAFQLTRLDELCEKTEALRVKLMLWGPPCPTLGTLGQIRKSMYTVLNASAPSFAEMDFAALMGGIGKTVSSTTVPHPSSDTARRSDLYGVRAGRDPVRPDLLRV